MPFQPSYPVPEDRRAYTLKAGPIGCLMLHGFLGSPISSRPMAEYLAERGITVHCPLLPGHGSLPNKLYAVTRADWLAEAKEGLAFIQERCAEIFLMGHSMGTVLGAALTLKNPDIKGMIMLAPAYRVPDTRLLAFAVLRYVMPWLYPLRMKSLHEVVYERLHDFDPTMDLADPAIQAQLPEMTRVPTGAIDEMRKTLDMGRKLWPQIDLPAIIFQGGADDVVDPANTRQLFSQLANDDKKFILFEKSKHELMRPFDPAHSSIWPAIYAFIRSHSTLSHTLPELSETGAVQ